MKKKNRSKKVIWKIVLIYQVLNHPTKSIIYIFILITGNSYRAAHYATINQKNKKKLTFISKSTSYMWYVYCSHLFKNDISPSKLFKYKYLNTYNTLFLKRF